jgi:FemAB-related protein (PEP-CTERM system-associated)
MTVEVCRFRVGEDAAWDAYVDRHPKASHYHLSGWRNVIQEAYGYPSHYLWVRKEGETNGILPLIMMRGILFKRSLVSLPFVDEAGICADDDETAVDLYETATRLAAAYRVDCLDLRHRYGNRLGLPDSNAKVTLVLELMEEPEQMWDRLDAKLRNQIRKAQKSGLTVSWHNRGGLDAFYDVFSVNMRDLGSPVHSRRFFAAVLKQFSGSARLVLVHKGRDVVGGGLCLSFKNTLLMPWASSRREYFSLCPNNLLYWEVIRRGCEEGYTRFDFGRSTPNTGPYRFKKQWGGTEEPLYWQYVAQDGHQGTVLKTDDPKYQWVIQAWQRLPVTVANLIGPCLRKRMSN